MKLRDSSYEEFNRITSEQGIHFESATHMKQSANNLVGLIELLINIDRKDQARKEQLKNEPQGFLINDGTYTCPLCGYWITDGVWYDKWGVKCLKCQDALTRKIIPGYVFKDHNNEKHVTSSELSYRYDIHPQTIKKLVRQGKLNARELPHGPLVFLRKDNPDLVKVIKEEQNR